MRLGDIDRYIVGLEKQIEHLERENDELRQANHHLLVEKVQAIEHASRLMLLHALQVVPSPGHAE